MQFSSRAVQTTALYQSPENDPRYTDHSDDGDRAVTTLARDSDSEREKKTIRLTEVLFDTTRIQ